jgi:hypothetical protein
MTATAAPALAPVLTPGPGPGLTPGAGTGAVGAAGAIADLPPHRLLYEAAGADGGVHAPAAPAVTADVTMEEEVGPGRYCPPRHLTHLEPSFLELNGIL